MTTVRALAGIPLLALALVACSDDDADTAATTAPAVTSAPASADTGSDGTVQSGPVQIDVLVGTDSGPDRVERVALGSEITLNITDPGAAQEYHIHGYELEMEVDQDVMATFNFTATIAGTFEVESHTTEAVLLVLQVS